MLRSLLVGVLALSAASACKGNADAPAVQPGVAVGKVVEATGDVSATRGTQKRALAAGQDVSGDDVIETGAAANIRIQFAHNHATWELGPNKKQLVSESLAWKLPKQDGPAARVDEATLAAGRHAERETVTTTTTAPGERAAAPAAQAPAAEAPATAPATGGGGEGEPPRTRHAAPPRPIAPPADTAPPKGDVASTERADDGTVADSLAPERRKTTPPVKAKKEAAPLLDSVAGNAKKTAPPGRTESPATSDVRQRVAALRGDLLACMEGNALSLEVVVAKGTVRFALPPKTSEKSRTCFAAIAAKLSFPADYDVTTTLALTK